MLPKYFIKPIHKLSTEACYLCENRNDKNKFFNVKEFHFDYSSNHFDSLFKAVNSIRHSEHVGDYIFVKFNKILFANESNNEYEALEILM